jgi:hypothetical protein
MNPIQPISVLLTHGAAGAMVDGHMSLPLTDLGTAYSMAQAVRWIDNEYFAVGRWDGTLTIFHRRVDSAGKAGTPIISAALIAPSLAGVEMITRIQDQLFASSNDDRSIVVWRADTVEGKGIGERFLLMYDPVCGVANDGTTTIIDGKLYFVTGHAKGYLLIWRVERDDTIELVRLLDLRSPNPVPSPYLLKNIRGVERARPGFVVTGSEDGDLCLVNVLNGVVVARTRYNPCAQRGINDVDTLKEYLIVANCSVGSTDSNLWLYRVGASGFKVLDSVNLKIDATLPQVFNFCVDQALVDGVHYFFAATQEGVVWVGLVDNDKLCTIGSKPVSTTFGAALAYEPTRRMLAVAGDNVHLYEVAGVR